MINKIEDFVRFFNEKSIVLARKEMNSAIKDYSIHILSKNNDFHISQEIFQNFKESKDIIVNAYCSNQETSYIIGFKKTIIIIDQLSLSVLHNLFSTASDLNIHFLKNEKNTFDKHIKIDYQYSLCDNIFDEEIDSFNSKLMIYKPKLSYNIKEFLSFISSCISGYLIKQSYSKLNKNRFNDIHWRIKKSPTLEIWDKKKYIEIRTLGIGSLFIVILIYHIEKEEFFALKKPNAKSEEFTKLIERELHNYSKIYHPFLPKFYGKVSESNYEIIEFINGQNLSLIKSIDIDDAIKIFFELIVVVKYLHENNFVLRDLNPKNIMIDQNKCAVLIDFDRMIDTSEKPIDSSFSLDLSSSCTAPEVNEGIISAKNDIYSLGMILLLIKQKISPDSDVEKRNLFENVFYMLFLRCTNEKPECRFTSEELYINYFKFFYNVPMKNMNIKEMIDKLFCESMEDPKMQFELAKMYEDGIHIERNINKAIYYYSQASEQNHSEAQLNLALIYEKGKYIKRDMKKSVYYYTLAANQNNVIAQNNLGTIYTDGDDGIQPDSNKAKYYFSLAANQNYREAQFNLGTCYELQRDFEKAFYYYKLAADQIFQ